LAQMGVVHYAGLVYRVGNEPLGHVFLMHDRKMSSEELSRVDPILMTAARHIGAQLELADLKEELQVWKAKANTDALTGLPNRRAFDLTVDLQRQLIESRSRSDSLLIVLDVDGLKAVNDLRGHAAGDQLIRAAANMLQSTLRDGTDHVFRIGGDEFAVVIDAPTFNMERWVEDRAQSWRGEIRRIGFPEAGISWGTARFSEANGTIDGWVSLADQRMYTAKRTAAVHR